MSVPVGPLHGGVLVHFVRKQEGVVTDIGPAAYVALVERADHRVFTDVDVPVSELNVLEILGLPERHFRPETPAILTQRAARVVDEIDKRRQRPLRRWGSRKRRALGQLGQTG